MIEKTYTLKELYAFVDKYYHESEEDFIPAIGDFVDWIASRTDNEDCGCRDVKRADGKIERHLCYEHAEDMWPGSSGWNHQKEAKPSLPEKLEEEFTIERPNGNTWRMMSKNSLCPQCFDQGLAVKTGGGLCDRHSNRGVGNKNDAIDTLDCKHDGGSYYKYAKDGNQVRCSICNKITMIKKWYDDWGIDYGSEGSKPTSIKIALPNAVPGIPSDIEIFEHKIKDMGARTLITIIERALTELSDRDREEQ